MDEKGPCEVGLKPLAAVLREIRRDAVVLFARPQELLPHSAPSPHRIRRYARSKIRLQSRCNTPFASNWPKGRALHSSSQTPDRIPLDGLMRLPMGQGPRSGTRNPLSQLDPPPAGATSLLTAYANVNISGGPGVGPSQDCVDTRTGSTAAPATANIACQDMQQNHFILSDGSSAEIDYLAGGGAEAIATFGKLGVGGALQHDRGGDPRIVDIVLASITRICLLRTDRLRVLQL